MRTPERVQLARAAFLVWLVGSLVCLIAWLWLRDPFEAALDGIAGRALSMLAPARWDGVERLWRFDALSLRILASRLLLASALVYGAFSCALHWQRVRTELVDFFGSVNHPINLAVFRIVVFWQVGSILWIDYIGTIAALPDALQSPPATGVPAIGPLAPLAHWFLHPLSPEQVIFWGNALRVAAVMGMIGLFTRFSSAVVAFGLFFVWGTLQWYGKVDHHHHLVWFTIVLAVARSGDALSIDALIAAWRRRGRSDAIPPGPSNAYGAPLAVCIALIGAIYLFPGIWKMVGSGLDWALSESPKYTMYRKWHTNGEWLPAFRFDHFPLLYRGGALFTMVFELTMLPLVLWRRTRLLAAGMGISFHLMTRLTMGIGFETLLYCYVVFVDWHRIVSWLRRRILGGGGDVAAPLAPRRARAVLWVGALLLAANLSMGVRRIQEGWPFACYPRFDNLVPDHYETLQIHAVAADGTERALVPSDYREVFGNRWSIMMRRIAHGRDEAKRAAQLRSVWRVIVERDPPLAKSRALRFSTARVWTDPVRWSEAPETGRLLEELLLDDVNALLR